MFTGKPDFIREDLDRVRGVRSTIGNIVHITHGKTDEILDVITAKNILENVHFKSIRTGEETFDFKVVGERSYDEHLVKGNRIVIPSEYEGQFIEFVIERVVDRRAESKTIEVFSYASFIELDRAKVIEPDKRLGTAESHLANAISFTEHEVGVVESNRERTMTFDKHTDPYDYIKRICTEFKLEPIFRVEHNGNRVTRRVVDLVDKVGAFRGREFTFGKDLEEIERTEEGDIYTALVGLSPEDDEGNRKEVYVEDIDALRIWGRYNDAGELQHRVGIYEPDSDRDDMTESQLRQYTQTELDKRKSAVIKYSMKALDLENIFGHEEKVTRFGDVIRAKDTMFEPPLYVEARIFEMRRNVITPMEKEYSFGDFVEYDAETMHDLFNRLKKRIDKKANIALLKEYAEPKRVESDTPPTGRNEHVIWVDTSQSPYVAKVYNGGKWEALSPTTAEELDAYTKQQADNQAQAKAEAEAEQALIDAKNFSRNASNIDSGVVNVGQIPLRTSMTGARLEWDGVNGLVQYDANGDAVSWLDLDANAHFANAFLSGRVEANEGFFGDNIRLRNKRMEIVRPDGAISMSDGMVDTSYTVTGNFPTYMTAGRHDAGTGRQNFPSFTAGAEGLTSAHIMGGQKGVLDGRGVSDNVLKYYDVRDGLGALAIQKYTFVHSAKYLIFKFRKYAGSTFSVHVVNGASASTSDRIYFEKFEDATAGVHTLAVDLGKPVYNDRTVTFKIGWTHGWGSKDEVIRFIMEGVYLTDFI